MSTSGEALVRLEEATAAWQRQLDLDTRIARTRADIPPLDAEARRTQRPFAISNAAAARAHLGHLEHEWASLGDAFARYEEAAAAREAELRSNRGTASDRLTEIARDRGRLHAVLRELREAIDAGRVAAPAVVELREALELVWRISVADSIFFANPLVDIDKYARIRRANEMLPPVNAALHAFAREIADVGVDAGMNAAFPPLPPLDISGPVAAFDALSTFGVESYVTHRVSRATTQAHYALTTVRQVLWSLEQRHGAHAATMHALDVERHDLLSVPAGE